MADLSMNIIPGCTSRGLTEKPMTGRGRAFEGTYWQRQVEVNCSRRSKTNYSGEVKTRAYDGHRLNIQVDTTLKTRLAFSDSSRASGWASALNRKMGTEQVEGLDPAFAHLVTWSSEPSWVHHAFQSQETSNMFRYLLPASGERENAKVTLGPGMLWFALKTNSFTPEEAGYLIDAVVRLVIALEAGPQPQRVVELNRWEVFVKEKPVLSVIMFFSAFLLISLILVLVLIAIAVVVASLSG